MTKDKYHHGDLKRVLIAAALDSLETQDASLISLRTIAAAVGVSHTAPKNHFGSLKGLMTAVAVHGHGRLAHQMRTNINPDNARPAQLSAAATSYLGFATDTANLYRLMFSSQLIDTRDAALKDAEAATRDILRQVSSGLTRHPADKEPAIDLLLWSILHGYASLVINHQISENGPMPPFSIETALQDAV